MSVYELSKQFLFSSVRMRNQAFCLKCWLIARGVASYRHGLRVSELGSLRWDQIDLAQGLVHIARLKNGVASVHPLRGPELRALSRLQREDAIAAYVFVSERKAPLTPYAVRKIVARGGQYANIEFPIHPHMLIAKSIDSGALCRRTAWIALRNRQTAAPECGHGADASGRVNQNGNDSPIPETD